MTKKENEQQNIEIALLKERVESVCRKVDKILDNHLPHLQGTVDKNRADIDIRLRIIENKIAVWCGAIIILGILAPYILNKFFN